MNSPSHGFIEVNGLRIHYLDFGGTGKPTLLLHGVTSHAWVWQDVAPHITYGRAIALDSRGHGDSQWSADQSYTTEQLASDVVSFIQLMDLGNVDIVGGSWGGLVGLAVASCLPALVDRLVMIDIPPSFPRLESDFGRHPTSYRSHRETIAYIEDNNEHPGPQIAEAVAAHGVRPGEAGRLHTKHDDYFHDHRPHRTDDHWERLRSARLPILFVRAGEDSFVSDQEAQRMLAVAPDGRWITIPESGHRISVDNPAALSRALTSFLASSSP